MNENKSEEKGMHSFCCGHNKKPLFLGLTLFIVGLMMQSQASVPEIIMIIGAMIVITSLISMFSRK